MPAITAGLYKVEAIFLAGGSNPAINRFWYRHSTGADDKAGVLFSIFNSAIGTLINDCHYPAYTQDLVRVTPIFGTGVPFVDTPGETAGQLACTGDVMAGHIAASIRMNRTTNETRAGWKRISGLCEDYVSGNTISGNLAASLNSLATAMEGNLVSGADTFIPCLVREPGTYVIGGTPTVQTGYVYNDVSTCQAILSRVTTQNSRKAW